MLILFALTFNIFICAFAQAEGFNDTSESYGKSEILSRRKRFLIFPEGSSVQLVFCNTFPSINVIQDIILWGYTAALAYELPQDPYSPFSHHADPLHRRVDKKEIYYLDEDGRILYKRPYEKKKLIVNPAFAKRSVDTVGPATNEQDKIDRKQMHSDHNREYLKGNYLGKSVGYHRESRALLYSKIETMLQGLGNNGKECLLKTLCVVAQTQHHSQGTFFHEILRAVFTFPKVDSPNDYLDDYDAAIAAKESCDVLYPDCNQPIEDPVAYVTQ